MKKQAVLKTQEDKENVNPEEGRAEVSIIREMSNRLLQKKQLNFS